MKTETILYIMKSCDTYVHILLQILSVSLNNRYILLNFPEDDVLLSYFPPFLVTNRRLRMYVGFPPFTKYEQYGTYTQDLCFFGCGNVGLPTERQILPYLKKKRFFSKENLVTPQ